MSNTKTHPMNKVYIPEGMPTLASYTNEINDIWTCLQRLPWTTNPTQRKKVVKDELNIAFPIGTVVFLKDSRRFARVVEFTKAGNPKLDNGDILKFVATMNHTGLRIEGRTKKGWDGRTYYIAIPNTK